MMKYVNVLVFNDLAYVYIYYIYNIYVSSPENHLLKRQAFAERSLQEASFLLRNVTSKNQPRCGFYPRKHEI